MKQKTIETSKEIVKKLKELLSEADLVKFAKSKPLSHEIEEDRRDAEDVFERIKAEARRSRRRGKRNQQKHLRKMDWSNVEFHNPEFLWLLIAIPLLAIWYFVVRKKDTAVLTISSVKGFNMKSSFLPKLKPLLYIFQIACFSLLICGFGETTERIGNYKSKSQQRN